MPIRAGLTDEALLELWRDRADREALDAFLERLTPFALAVARSVSSEGAEDAVQDAFLHVVDRAGSFRSGHRVRPWLARVVLNAAATRVRGEVRRRHREEVRRAAATVVEAGPAETVETAECRRALSLAIDLLDPEERVPVILHYQQGMTQIEIAEVLGISQPTVGQRLERAIARLRRAMASSGFAGVGAGVTGLIATMVTEPVPAALTAKVSAIAAGAKATGGAASAAAGTGGMAIKVAAAILGTGLLVGTAAVIHYAGRGAPQETASVPRPRVESRPVPVNRFRGRQEREEIFEFADRPRVVRTEGKWIVTFSSKGLCDATVSVVDRDGRIVRHVASGVLGRNAPWPFQQDTHRQRVEWDGNDEFGRPAPAGCRVRVGLGLRFTFDRQYGWMAGRLLSAQGLTVDGEGQLYVLRQYEDVINVSVFDRQGRYLRTILPHPASVPPERMSLIEWSPTTRDDQQAIVRPGSGAKSYDRYRIRNSTDLFPTQQGPAVTPDGRLILSFGRITRDVAVKGCKFAILDKRDGSAPAGEGFGFVDADVGARGGPLGEGGVFMAVSPDGQWLYTGGSSGENSRVKCSPSHAVSRMPLDRPGQVEVFLGEQSVPAGDPGHFNDPRGVACDREGRLYVADRGNDRVQVFSSDGALIKSLSVGRPEQVAVHPGTGAIYVGCASGNGLRLVKFGGLDAPEPEAFLRLPEYGMMALDAVSDPPAVWVSAEGIRRYVDGGNVFEAGLALHEVNGVPEKMWGSWTASDRQMPLIAVDPLREELYVRSRGGITDGSDVERVDGRTGVLIETLSGGIEQVLGAGPDGLVYMRAVEYPGRTWLLRYDPDARKWLPFPENTTVAPEDPRHGRGRKGAAAEYPRGPYIPSGQAARGYLNLWTVAPNGDIYVVARPEEAQIQELKRSGQPYPLGSPDEPGSGVRRANALQVFTSEGRRKTSSALPGLCGSEGPNCIQVRVGRGGALYVAGMFHPAGQGVPDGIAPEGKYGRDMWGGVVRFLSSYDDFPLGRMVGGWGEPLDGPPTLFFGEGAGIPIRTEDAMWVYGGIAPLVMGDSTWWGNSFDLDAFDRLFVPAAQTCSVNVLDTNGNLVLRVGGYGNADSRGEDSAVADPKTGLLRPRQPDDPADVGSPLPGLAYLMPRYAAISDEALYVEDMENERIVRAVLGYHAEEEYPLP